MTRMSSIAEAVTVGMLVMLAGTNDFWERYLANPDTMLWPTSGQVISPGG